MSMDTISRIQIQIRLMTIGKLFGQIVMFIDPSQFVAHVLLTDALASSTVMAHMLQVSLGLLPIM